MSLLFGMLTVFAAQLYLNDKIDVFEVAVLIGAMFLVNYVTADAKTNWLEGFAMVSFYSMIVSVFERSQSELT